jgi:hypothetical protein
MLSFFFSNGVPNVSLMRLLYFVLAFMFLMIVVGWLAKGKEQDRSEARHETKKPAKKDGQKVK